MKYSVAVSVCMAVVAVGSVAGCSVVEPMRSAASSAARSAARHEGRTVANYFRVGDCFKEPAVSGTSVTIVGCERLHAAEVYAIFPLPDGPFPGKDIAAYKKECGAAARAYAPDRGDDTTLKTDIRYPDETTWAMGDRSVTCIATSNPPRRGSIHQ